jgi:tryptophan synthase beta chain
MSAHPQTATGPGLEDLLAGRLPDARGRFGPFGGRYVPETLVPALERLEAGVRQYLHDDEFRGCLAAELRDWVGRATPLTPAPGLGRAWNAEVWLKREDLAHTGAHKINNALGQAMLAKALGARRIVAETGAGQHGVAWAAACARPAWFTWGPSIVSGSRQTSIACAGWVRTWCR